jgi:hypothetical protein
VDTDPALPEAFAVTVRVVRALERLGVRYLIGGSLASSLHGVPRATNDADLVAELPGAKVTAFVEDLRQDFYVDADMILDAIRRAASFNVVHLATMFKVDVFVGTRDPMVQEELSRRTEHRLVANSDLRAYFASAEDTVLQKLDWYAKGGGVSDRQWSDVLGVIKVQGAALDREYLHRWAPALGIEPLLQRALDEAEPT